MVALTRLLDLVPGRSGEAYTSWLRDRGDAFRKAVEVATLDPFHGYKNAIDDQLEDAVAVLDAFHVVKLGTAAVEEVRRRVQQDIHGHRGRSMSSSSGRPRSTRSAAGSSRTSTATEAAKTTRSTGSATCCAPGRNTSPTGRRPASRRRSPPTNDTSKPNSPGTAPNSCAPSIYHQPCHADGRRVAEQILASFPTCPIPEIARLGRTLNQWREAFLGYFTTSGANNGGTEAINGLIELARRVARGFRDPDNYRLRMLLIGGGLRL